MSATELTYLDQIRAKRLRAWPGELPREVYYPLGERPIGEYLEYWAREAPERLALSFHGHRFTFAELDRLSSRFAGWLDSVGVRPGHRVAVHLPNSPQLVIAFHGALKLGAVYVPINPMLRVREVAHELSDSEPSAVITLDTLAATITEASEDMSFQLLVVSLDDYPTAVSANQRLVGRPEASDWWRALESAPLTTHSDDLDALAALNYTGGTTGMPKGCEHTQRHMLYTAVTTAAAWGLGQDFGGNATDASVVFFPLFWIAGEDLGLLLPVVTGTTCILFARWDSLGVLRAIDQQQATHMVGTVESYAELLEHPEGETYELSTLRRPFAASFVRKLDVQMRNAWRERAGQASTLRECAFGMTETHTMDSCTVGFQRDDADLRSRPVFCGLPMPGTDLKIVDFDTGALKMIGEEGEIAIRSPSILTRYWRSPEATDAAIRDGWLHTGDVGSIDEDGCLHYLGRNKEMIKVNGMSVFPAELEVLLGVHPDISAIAVVPRTDEARGQVPLAYVELRDGAGVSAEDLTEWAEQTIARYKLPEIRIVAALPRTDTGKIKKGDLLEHA